MAAKVMDTMASVSASRSSTAAMALDTGIVAVATGAMDSSGPPV